MESCHRQQMRVAYIWTGWDHQPYPFFANYFQRTDRHAFSVAKLCTCALHTCKRICLTHKMFVCLYVCISLTRLEHHVQDKEKMERELYSRFVMVLNDKKAKIRSLQDAMRQLQQATGKQRDEEGRERSAGGSLAALMMLWHLSSLGTLRCKAQ